MVEKTKTGIMGLDTMLKGGLIKGRDILLTGPCGAGKTILGMQFIYHGIQNNEPGLYVTLEERKSNLYQDMSTLGFDLKSAEDTGKFMLVGGKIAGLDKYMKRIDANVSHIIMEIEEIIKQKSIKRVVIDSLNLLTMLMKDEEEKRKHVAELCHMLSGLGCTSLLITESAEGTMSLSKHGFEEFVADGVIVLYLARQGSKFIPGISIRKMRGTDHDKEIRLYSITANGIIVYPQETLFTGV